MPGPLHPRWKGGKTIRQDGYVRIKAGKDRDKLEHRKIWEEANGPIPEGFDVHHLDEDKANNVLANFELRPSLTHRAGHLNHWKTRMKKTLVKS